MLGSGSLLTFALSVGCSTTIRGPVDLERRRGPRDRPVGESTGDTTESPTPRNVVVDAVTFPVQLVRMVLGALVD
jgi:hypothetical protein